MVDSLNNSVNSEFWKFILKTFQGFDWFLLIIIFSLFSLSLTIMNSAGGESNLIIAHLRNIFFAIVVLFFVAQIPSQIFMKLAIPTYFLVIALLVGVLLFGITKNGAKRWLNIGITIQPSELLKIAMPLMLAWWFQSRSDISKIFDFLVAFIILGIPVALIFKQPDLGTALLVLSAGLSVIFFSGLSWKLVIPAILIAVIGISFLIFNEETLCQKDIDWKILHDYQKTRICTLLDPMRDPLGSGFHTIQGVIAIGSGGLTGKGLFKGTQTHLDFIPERTTDFIFTVYSEELGLIGNLILISLFLLLVWRSLFIALKAKTKFEQLICSAVGMIFFTYDFVNIGMVSGILPVVGVPLPFISYGGTAMVTLGFSLGILMSVKRHQNLAKLKEKFI